ncbi:hypothetical protein HXX76_005858 [Chlamydomonas incerta]|uniref:Ribosome-binding factor A n=1 Tax=Chlamydomonas incerta TaxID=51695 RepID=A0A835TB98_CHLIN|nr:hypothetical protein HXX76_005858 [Chlamydomonas incerta]|eukprot:KAG2437194.1 hypothetical protein HXX76_005858 [Chlamydomonas incerta]
MSSSFLLSSFGSRGAVSTASTSSSACAPPPASRALRSRAVAPRSAQPVQHRRGRLEVVCMAHPRRVAKVSSAIQREVGDMFVSDPVIQAAICPERKLGDDALSAVASITNTYVSNDLQVVKVFVSVYSDDYGKRVAMENLQRLEPYVRRLIGQRVRLRLTPEIRFVYDDAEEEADLVARVIGREEVERYREEIEADMMPKRRRSGGADDEDEDEEDEAGRAQAGAEGAGEGEDDEEEEDEFEEGEDEDFEDPDERPQEYPDPFGDLFIDDREYKAVAGQRVEERRRSQGRAQPQGRGQGRRGQGRRGQREAQAAAAEGGDE